MDIFANNDVVRVCFDHVPCLLIVDRRPSGFRSAGYASVFIATSVVLLLGSYVIHTELIVRRKPKDVTVSVET